MTVTLPSPLKRLCAAIAVLLFAGLGASCEQVQAWERGVLARPEMAIEVDPMETTLNNHIYFSKEASNGGHSASGGGCGCN